MVSKVELVNIALEDMLGVGTIAGLGENSTAARAANRRVDDAARMVLQMSDWSFARKVAALAEVTNDDWTERYERKYSLPNDCVKAVRLVPYNDVPNTAPMPYEIMNGYLYTDEPEAKLRYTYANLAFDSWPLAFAEAVAAYLARTLAMPLTRKRQIFVDMNSVFTAALSQAVEFDAAQEPMFWSYPSGYLEARGATSGRYDTVGVDGSSYWGN